VGGLEEESNMESNIQHDQTEPQPRPGDFDDVRKLSKRPWGGALKAATCFCCGSGLRLLNHHIEPRDAGGSDSPRNKVTLCTTCHDAVEGMEWKEILARRDRVRAERYSRHNREPKSAIPESESWVGRTPLNKAKSVRQHCFNLGVLNNTSGRQNDFQMAFRTLNEIYEQMCPKEIRPSHGRHIKVSAMGEILWDASKDPLRREIDRLLYEGTQEEWVRAIVTYASAAIEVAT
jgi:HNH endonuclease